jgi:hypothetical protein
MERSDAPGSGPRPFGKHRQADAAIEPALGIGNETAVAVAAATRADIAERLHQPAVERDAEMRLELDAPHQLRHRGIDDEGVEKIDVVGHEKTRAGRVEAGGAFHAEADAGQPEDVARERTHRAVVADGIDEKRAEGEQRAADREMHETDRPHGQAADDEPRARHTST